MAREAFGELLRREAREAAVEVLDDRSLDALAGEEGELLREGREARGRLARGEELARQRLEGEHGGRQPPARRGAPQLAEHRRVAAMHAVEASHGDRAVAAGGRMSHDAHRYSWREKSASRNPMIQSEPK